LHFFSPQQFDGTLTEENVAKLLNHYDANGNGKIDLSEFAALGQPATSREARGNGNGKIDLSECAALGS
jgi:hypothetical protein